MRPTSSDNISKVVLRGRKASNEFSTQARSLGGVSQRSPITAGAITPGVCQKFVLEGTHPATVVIPITLARHVQQEYVFDLLEAQRVEQLLVDSITSPTPPDITTRYYSQLLMAQRLQRAELEAELYRAAIERDGLCLLEDEELTHESDTYSSD